MEKEELKEQVKKAFSVMHDDELYDAWDKFAQTMNYTDTVTVFSMNELDDYFDGWNAKRLLNIFRDSPNFKISDEYFSFYNGRLVSTASLNVDFKPIAYYLESAIDYVVGNKDDLGNARLEEILDGMADEGAFMSFEDDFLRVMRTLTAEELVKAYNECMRHSPEDMIYPMDEFYELWDSSKESDEVLDASGNRFSFNDDWFCAVFPDYNVFESFTDLTIDDAPINENMEYILQEVTENNNDFGIQKIRDFIENHKAYGDFG